MPLEFHLAFRLSALPVDPLAAPPLVRSAWPLDALSYHLCVMSQLKFEKYVSIFAFCGAVLTTRDSLGTLADDDGGAAPELARWRSRISMSNITRRATRSGVRTILAVRFEIFRDSTGC